MVVSPATRIKKEGRKLLSSACVWTRLPELSLRSPLVMLAASLGISEPACCWRGSLEGTPMTATTVALACTRRVE
jgi:hypothetical protein